MLSCPEKLSADRRYKLELASNEVYLNAMSITELVINFDPVKAAEEMDVQLLSFRAVMRCC